MSKESPQYQSLTMLPRSMAICRLPAESSIPDWARPEGLMAAVFTSDELSIICEGRFVPPDMLAERGWRAFKVEAPLDFALVGVLASLLTPLAEANVNVVAISTYDTDYILVKEAQVDRAIQALESAGHSVIR